MKKHRMLTIIVVSLVMIITSVTFAEQYQLQTLASFTIPNTRIEVIIRSIVDPNDEDVVFYCAGGKQLLLLPIGENLCILLNANSGTEMEDAMKNNTFVAGIISQYTNANWVVIYSDSKHDTQFQPCGSWDGCCEFWNKIQ